MHRVAEQSDAREIGAHVGEAVDAQACKAAVAIDRKFGVPVLIAGLVVAHEGLRAGRAPMHGTADELCCKKQRWVLWIARSLHAEAAADVVGQHTQLVWSKTHGRRRLHFDAVHALGSAPKRISAARSIIAGGGDARLHRDGGDALVEKADAGDACGFDEGQIHGLAPGATGIFGRGPVERGIAGCFGPELERAGGGFAGVDRHGQRRIFDGHRLCRVVRLRLGLGDDQSDGLSDVHHAFSGERGAHGAKRAGAILAYKRHVGRHARKVGAGEALGRDHGDDAGHAGGLGRIDAFDAGMGVRRTDEHRCSRSGGPDVVAEATAALQQRLILDAALPAVLAGAPRRCLPIGTVHSHYPLANVHHCVRLPIQHNCCAGEREPNSRQPSLHFRWRSPAAGPV